MVGLCLTPDLEIRAVINFGTTRLVKHKFRNDKENLAVLSLPLNFTSWLRSSISCLAYLCLKNVNNFFAVQNLKMALKKANILQHKARSMVGLCLTPDLEIRAVINFGTTRLVKHKLRNDKENLAVLSLPLNFTSWLRSSISCLAYLCLKNVNNFFAVQNLKMALKKANILQHKARSMVGLCLTPDLEIRAVINFGTTRLVKHKLRNDKENLAVLSLPLNFTSWLRSSISCLVYLCLKNVNNFFTVQNLKMALKKANILQHKARSMVGLCLTPDLEIRAVINFGTTLLVKHKLYRNSVPQKNCSHFSSRGTLNRRLRISTNW